MGARTCRFLKLLPSLLTIQRGKYVAVHEGQVVDSGDDETALALRAYDQIGYVPIFVGLITDDPRPVMRMPSPRLYRRRGRRRSPTVTGSSCKSTSELVAGDD